MRVAIVVFSVIWLAGCMSSKQLEAELAFYKLQEAQIQHKQQQDAKPLFELVAADGSKDIVLQNVSALRVYQPTGLSEGSNKPTLHQYAQRDYAAPWVGLAGSALQLAIPAFAAYKTIDSVARNAGTTITNAGAGSVTTGGTGTNLSGTGAWLGDDSSTTTDSTHTPTIVEQPAPIIVPSPDPIIVPTPDPIIVQPSYPPAP